MTRALLALAIAALLGGATTAAEPEGGSGPAPDGPPEAAVAEALGIPREYTDAIAFAERRGRELYEHDQVAWHATDAARPASRRWKRKLAGWITVPQPGSARPLVRFLSEPSPGVYASRLDVIVGVTSTRLLEHDPALELPEDEQALARARALAIRERKRQCTKTLNSVALRDASGEIHVYLLAASAKRGEVVLAGHDLARVSADGTKLLAWRPFSRSCLVTEAKPGAVAQVVSHNLDEHPVETHVFTNLNYGFPLYVITLDRRAWRVDAGEISVFKEPE